MRKADLDILTKQGSAWRCELCGSERRKSIQLDAKKEKSNLSLEDLISVLNDIMSDKKKNDADFNKSYETFHERLEENTTTFQVGMTNIEDYVKNNLRIKE